MRTMDFSQALVAVAVVVAAGGWLGACRSRADVRPSPGATSAPVPPAASEPSPRTVDAGAPPKSSAEDALLARLCAGRAGCRFEAGTYSPSSADPDNPTLLLELVLPRDAKAGCTPRELWSFPARTPEQAHVTHRTCADKPILARTVAPPAQPEARKVAFGPGWVPMGQYFEGDLAFSANGLWFASFVSGGVLLGDSRSGRPLALAPFSYDKAIALAFHPSNQQLVAIADFTLLVLEVEREAGNVRLRIVGALPQPAGGIGLHPPLFDDGGRFLAVAEHKTAVLYDWKKRRPIARIDPGFESSAWVMGFSRDTLYLVEPTTAPCNCDDYQGSRAAVASYRLGGRQVRRQWLGGDVMAPLHLRQGKVAGRGGLWDTRTGQPRTRYRLSAKASVVDVFRLRSQAASVATVMREDSDAQELVVLADDGAIRELGRLPDTPLSLAVRPQDDLAVFWGLDQERTLFFVSLADGWARRVLYEEKVCVEAGEVVPDERCPFDGAELERPKLDESPESDANPPTYAAPAAGPPAQSPKPELERD